MTSRTGKPRSADRRAGFTLVELLLVVLILGVVLGLSLPRFERTFEHMKVRSLSRNLHALLRHAQERAILDQRFYRVVYLADKNVVRLEKKDGEKFSAVTGPRGRPVKLEGKLSLGWSGRSAHVDFGPEGEMNKAQIDVLLDGRRQFRITVGEPLGRIVFEETD